MEKVAEPPKAILSYPSSAKHKVDFVKAEKEVEQQEKSENPEGSQELNDWFKQLYKNADEDTRRAMLKSYQTSGGTVLSTNWKEVKEKDYEKEISPPKGQEVHKWSELAN